MLLSVMLSPLGLLASLAHTLLDRIAPRPKPRLGPSRRADVVPIEHGRRASDLGFGRTYEGVR
jgi:hypothetical protein